MWKASGLVHNDLSKRASDTLVEAWGVALRVGGVPWDTRNRRRAVSSWLRAEGRLGQKNLLNLASGRSLVTF